MTPYAQRINETAKAYAAFRAYCDMGEERTLRSVGEKFRKSETLIERWSSRHEWKERVAAWDANVMSVGDSAEKKKLQHKAGIWAARAEQVREVQYEMAGLLMAKAQAMLKWPLAKTTTEDGKTVLHPTRWSLADAARVCDVAARLQCLATGRTTGSDQTTSVEVTVNNVMSPEQKAARLREVFGVIE